MTLHPATHETTCTHATHAMKLFTAKTARKK